MSSRSLCALLTVLFAAVATHAQTFTYHAETRLIEMAVSVHGSDGGLVQGLTAGDFRIVEDGAPQQIRFFSHDRQLPLSIGLLVDASGSQEKFVKEHEKDIQTFLAEVLEPTDDAFAVCFGNHLRLVADRTSTPAQILDGLHRFDKGSRDFPELGPIEDRDLGTALYDAVYFSVQGRLSNAMRRRKVLLILSDGQENSSEHDLLDAIAIAQNANVLVYALRYTEHHHNGMNARDRYGMRVLDHLAQQTGGRTWSVDTTKVPTAFAELAGELRSLYDVAYQSTNHEHDGLFRKVVVSSPRTDLSLRSRTGYYARPEPAGAVPTQP